MEVRTQIETFLNSIFNWIEHGQLLIFRDMDGQFLFVNELFLITFQCFSLFMLSSTRSFSHHSFEWTIYCLCRRVLCKKLKIYFHRKPINIESFDRTKFYTCILNLLNSHYLHVPCRSRDIEIVLHCIVLNRYYWRYTSITPKQIE